MDAIGIVCEYNPFHQGHLYHIRESKRLFGTDAVIVCAMSGDFVQRGEAAFFSKLARAEAACRAGADLVFELPLPWCLSSADIFAEGAVSMLSAAGCAALSFGCECDDQDLLRTVAEQDLLLESTEAITQLLKQNPKLSYAQARQRLLEDRLKESVGILAMPNNILAVAYWKAILRNRFSMRPLAVKREGSNHDTPSEGLIRSAMQLRSMLEAGEEITPYIPEEAARVLQREYAAGRVYNRERMELLLLSRLYRLEAADFESLPDAGHGAGQRLYKALLENRGTAQSVQAAATKRYTAARMRRIVLSAALDIRADDAAGRPPYMRLLAANQKGRSYLHSLGETAIPIVTKPADVKKLSLRAAELFAQGAKAHDVYTLQFVTNDDILWGEDWKSGPVIV
ncbi:MAG: nucleotidyltransferase family protein [Oscillospiraceae bacterium]|nr:nucleotidyltransferase family protein [Oscillospiraceae bacterium]